MTIVLALLVGGCEELPQPLEASDARLYQACIDETEDARCSDGTRCKYFPAATIGSMCTIPCSTDADCPTSPERTVACETFAYEPTTLCVVRCAHDADCPSTTFCHEFERVSAERIGVCIP